MTMKRIIALLICTFSALLLASPASPRYIFLFIGDGMSTPQRMIAEEFARAAGHGQLSINALPAHGTTRTCSANSLVTDSAAAATAIACGEKTDNGRIGMSADGSRRLESVAEVARDCGRKVGVITSVTINHATPAGFYAHRNSRGMTYQIGLDLIASSFDFFGGGGFEPVGEAQKNAEYYKGDLYELAEQAGYRTVSGRAGLASLRPGCGKAYARGAAHALPYYLDMKEDDLKLWEFVAKGIELLDNPNGFFMMVEGGSIDWCGHANDAATNLNEVLQLDLAVREALKFSQTHPDETLIIVTGDHETGGMTMGFAGTGYAMYVDRLVHQKCSPGAFSALIRKEQQAKTDFSFEDAKVLISRCFGFDFTGDSVMKMSPSDVSRLEAAFREGSGKLADACRRIISEKAGIGWTSGAHTGLPVLTTSTGPCSAEFTGFYENTELARRLKAVIRRK